ncbi:UDP-N-acetylglucosamine 2-epimerase (non-hydrolyzing) [Candidatus Woesearchaeota archaeon]|nr:UDP-N-acetylglucosamine 2-epimerase (non-hydrolyzing) [Candidatus Woesearchaeota archaeon]
MTKIAIVLGTRPEIVKMAPIIRECEKRQVDYFILHTGQHYSYTLDKKLFEDLDLPEPKYNLEVGSQQVRKQVGIMTREIAEVLQVEKPDVVIVQGDTISVLAGALAAKKVGIKVAHHEAGLRSHDLTMLEETNRITVDHVSDFLFAPTQDALKNLHEEGFPRFRVVMTGNTIVDAVLQNIEIAKTKVNALGRLNLMPKKYILTTVHRAENANVQERLKGIMEGLGQVAEELQTEVIFPIHPRTAVKLKEFEIILSDKIQLIEPVGFLEMLQLEANARLIITDSGGLQEEASILKVPCVTVRDNTERPETIAAGINILAGAVPENILESAKKMIIKDGKDWGNIFGDGKAAERIIATLLRDLKTSSSAVSQHSS